MSFLICFKVIAYADIMTPLYRISRSRSITLQQRNYSTAILPLQRNCCILCVRVNLKVVLSFNYCLIFFISKLSFGRSFFNLQLLLNCIFKTAAVMSRCCNVSKPSLTTPLSFDNNKQRPQLLHFHSRQVLNCVSNKACKQLFRWKQKYCKYGLQYF